MQLGKRAQSYVILINFGYKQKLTFSIHLDRIMSKLFNIFKTDIEILINNQTPYQAQIY